MRDFTRKKMKMTTQVKMSNETRENKSDFDLKMTVYKQLEFLEERQTLEVQEQTKFYNLIPDACADLKTLEKFIKDFDEEIDEAYVDHYTHSTIDDLRESVEMMQSRNLESEVA